MFKNPFKKKNNETKEYNVVIPKEEYAIGEWIKEDLPVVAMLNTALKDFEPKEVFS